MSMYLFQDEDDYQPPILGGRKYTAPLNAFNDLAKEDKVCSCGNLLKMKLTLIQISFPAYHQRGNVAHDRMGLS